MPIEITKRTIEAARKAVTTSGKPVDIVDLRAQGLRLRVGRRRAAWFWRSYFGGRLIQVELGSVEEWSIAEARQLAGQATAMVHARTGKPDERWLHEQRIRHGKISRALLPTATTRTEFSRWDFREARDMYLGEVRRTRSVATYEDYRRMLNVNVLAPLLDDKVAQITRQRLAEIVAQVHQRGTERQAEHLASVLRPMWSWLGADAQQARSGVQPETMRLLRAPVRSRRPPNKEGGLSSKSAHYVPELAEVGRILSIARSLVFDPAISRAIELLVMTVQRRRPVVSARIEQFVQIKGKGGAWRMPPSHRKTANRRGDESDHVVPLPPFAWSVVTAQIEAVGGRSEWLFPQFRPRREGGPVDHMDAALLTRALLLMPGVSASPHDLRRAFATRGEEELGFSRADVKSILDHNEGVSSGDVTRASYSLGAGLASKWPVMKTWSSAVESALEVAVEDDARLADYDWLSEEISKARYKRS